MPLDLLVVSVSRRGDGRSIAGMDEDGRFIRLIAPSPSGILYPSHYRMSDEADPRPYDLIRVDAPWLDNRPSQPENRIVSAEPWQLLERPASRPHIRRFEALPAYDGALFGNSDRAIRSTSHFVDRSLAVVDPDAERVTAHCVWQENRQRFAARVRFEHCGAIYDLPLSDIHWSARVLRQPEGKYNLQEIDCRAPHGLRMIVSLTEPFHGFCYKLVTCMGARQRATLWRDAAPSNLSDPERIALNRPLERAFSAARGA